MREILFRGKRKDGQGWSEGNLQYYPNWNRCFISTNDANRTGSWEVEKKTVGQFTGLQDKYDRKIYDGDILGAHLFEDEPDYETRVVVEWHEAGWYAVQRYSDLKPCYNPLHEALDGNRFEIIGNIHDNLELIIREKNDA